MSFLRSILLIGIFGFTVVMFATVMGSTPCTEVVDNFLRYVQSDDTESLIHQFGENSCHCQPRGGYMAYLKYESGENDNIAFLYGHKFKFGSFVVKSVPTIEKVPSYHLPGSEPESAEVDVPVSFDKTVYSPYFVPLDSAYGYPIKEQALHTFCQNPEADFWKALTLRLRAKLEAGVVPKDADTANSKNHEPKYMADLFKEIVPPDQAKYLKPTDLGNVEASAGKSERMSKFANELPRLKSGILRIYVGRRGKLERWAIKKARMKDPIFALANGKDLALKTPEETLTDLHGPAADSSSASASDTKPGQ